MKHLIFALTFTAVITMPLQAQAEDGFGSYFSNSGTAGFGSPANDVFANNEAMPSASDIANIEPAAGDEAPTNTPSMESSATEAITKIEPAAGEQMPARAQTELMNVEIDNKKSVKDLRNIQNDIQKALKP